MRVSCITQYFLLLAVIQTSLAWIFSTVFSARVSYFLTYYFSSFIKVINVNHHWEEDYTKLQEEHNILKARYATKDQQNQQLQQENTRLLQALETSSLPLYTSQQTRVETNIFSNDDIEALKQQVGFFFCY
jgi:hypothetical protein